MKRITFVTVAVFLLFALVSSKGAQPNGEVPKIKATCVEFFKACKQEQFARAKTFLAKMNTNATPAHVADELRQYGESDFDPSKLTDTKVMGNKAIVVHWESQTDPDPFYFVRENGAWKILLPLTTYRHPAFSWSEKDFNDFATLEKWFKDYKNEHLYKKKPARPPQEA